MATSRSGRAGASRAAARITMSKPLRGTRRLTAVTIRASSGRPRRRRVVRRSSCEIGMKRSVSTPGGMTTEFNRRPAQRCASASGYPPAAMTRSARRSSDPMSWALPGRRPGTVISAPCRTYAIGRSIWGASAPSGSTGSSTTIEASTSCARRLMRRAKPGCGSSTLSGVRTIRMGDTASNASDPEYGVVSTVVAAGGSRRHNSQR